MNEEDSLKINIAFSFKNRTIDTINDVINMVQCIIPIDSKDKKILTEGIDKLEEFKNKLEKAENLRELSEFIDINKLMSEHDSIKREVDSSVTYSSYCKFMEKLESMVDDGTDGED